MSKAVVSTTEVPAIIKAPARKKRKKPAKARKAVDRTKDAPIRGGEFAGVSATNCCAGCTLDHCLISTVGQCKHPYKTGESGCGPITMANRAKVRKLIKHQQIDAR